MTFFLINKEAKKQGFLRYITNIWVSFFMRTYSPKLAQIYMFQFNVNTMKPRQNYCHFTDDIFTCIFFNENAWISLKISLKFVLKFQFNNIPALDQKMPVIICAQHGKNPSRTVLAVKWTQQDVPIFSRFFFCKVMVEWPWWYSQRSC